VDQIQLLLLLAVVVLVALAVLGLMRSRPMPPVTPGDDASTYAVSTEGEKLCPKCGMGNLWTDRACISCRAPLRG
jgi:hypothetical protein